MAFSAWAGSRLKVSDSISASRGMAPKRAMVPAVAKKRKGRGQDHIPRPNPEGHERQEQGIGPGGYPYGKPFPHIGGYSLFQFFYRRPEDELPGIQNPSDRRIDF